MVEIMATIMMMMSGIAASLVNKTDNDERAAKGLDHADKGSHHIGIGNADIGEAAGPKKSGKESF